MWTHMKSIHPSVAINGSTEASQKTKVKRQTSLREYQACKAKLTPTRYVLSDVLILILILWVNLQIPIQGNTQMAASTPMVCALPTDS